MTAPHRSVHIVYVESGYPHAHGGGGAGTYVQLIGRELVRQGHQVTVVTGYCPDCPLSLLDGGVQVWRPNVNGPLHWYASRVPGVKTFALALRSLEQGWGIYRFIESLHRDRPIDVLEITEGGDVWHALFHRFPAVAHLHGSRYTSLRQAGKPVGRSDWHQRRLELLAISRADWVVSPSQAMLDVVQQEAGKPFPRVEVIPYPLDPCLLQRPHTAGTERYDKKIVLFAARNDPVKGADVLLDAVPLVRRQIPDAEFHLYGYQSASGARLPDGVVSFPFVPKSELLAQYHQADLVVVPSRWDNSPNTVYEAMAAGKAVVASQVGGIPELVADGETGLLVPPGDVVALAEALVGLLSNHHRLSEMGEAGRERIQRIAGLEANIQRRLRIYREAVHQGV